VIRALRDVEFDRDTRYFSKSIRRFYLVDERLTLDFQMEIILDILIV